MSWYGLSPEDRCQRKLRPEEMPKPYRWQWWTTHEEYILWCEAFARWVITGKPTIKREQ